MKKIMVSIILLSIISLTLYGCFPEKSNSEAEKNTLTVYASIYPLYDFTKKIGKEKVNVHLIIPAGAEPHDWEPSAKLMAKIQEADLFIYNGLGMESWAERIIQAVDHPDLIVVNTSDNIEWLELGEEDDHHHDKESKHSYDPHLWLDPLRAMQQAEHIKNALIEADSKNKDFYEDNFLKLKEEFLKLDKEYQIALSQLSKNEIVVSHTAFGYLADRYNLRQLSVSGLSPQAEPSPNEMANLTDFIKEHNVEYIFYEPLSNSKLIEVIAEETGVKMLTLNPLGNITQEDLDEGKDYFSIMRENLESLKKALTE